MNNLRSGIPTGEKVAATSGFLSGLFSIAMAVALIFYVRYFLKKLKRKGDMS